MNVTFDNPLNREEIAAHVAAIFNAGPVYKIPYKPNKSDDSYWTLDTNNDWKIKFSDDSCAFEIKHRYRDEKAIEAITTWLAYRLGGNVHPGMI